ncbi:hypothetical protein NIES21_20170 [Anabaenopsis circularis NIES-21]|uniref:Pepco domain-containing protein n=1 Tax=Anabaenopsis circularis NIES-21 TaxID=1085406 RepID=A0A1Z4GFB9_9CYAN|nr:hypothetical protein NIES21_20170 [Anabaenopsis circularis NIES-21]
MSDTPPDSILIVTDDVAPITIPDGAKSGINNPRGGWGNEVKEPLSTKGDAVPVSAQKLEQNMTQFLQLVGRLFSRAEQQANSKMQLEEIELSVEISGEGEVKLIGSGAKASGKGAIKLTFKRQEPK